MGGVGKRLVGALIDPSMKKILSALRSPRKCAHKFVMSVYGQRNISQRSPRVSLRNISW